jgi:hypothetical protein
MGLTTLSKMLPLQRQSPPLPAPRRQTAPRRNRRCLHHHRQRRRSQTQRQQLTVLGDESRRNPSEQSPGRHLLAQDSSQLRFSRVADDGVGDAIS